MKLLIVTQAVDRADPILGFFHRWIEEFAGRCERVTVVAQRVGDHSFPANVFVRSLGKEEVLPKWRQVLRFWAACSTEDYDAVLVHMTPVWSVLGALPWALRRKRSYLWYEVRRGGWVLRAALLCVRTVFSATAHGLPRASAKQCVVGHGIDTAFFRPPTLPRDPYELLAVGRVTRVKRLDAIIGCLAVLPVSFRLRLIGPTVTDDDKVYKVELVAALVARGMERRVTFETADQRGVAEALRRARVFLHGAAGGLDKALLEAMSCACPVLSCSEAADGVLPPACRTTPERMAEDLWAALADGRLETETLLAGLRDTVEREHGLQALVARLVSAMEA